jgi:hypothetical protein
MKRHIVLIVLVDYCCGRIDEADGWMRVEHFHLAGDCIRPVAEVIG